MNRCRLGLVRGGCNQFTQNIRIALLFLNEKFVIYKGISIILKCSILTPQLHFNYKTLKMKILNVLKENSWHWHGVLV